MGKQGRTVKRLAAVGAGVVLAGSMWTGSAAAQTTTPPTTPTTPTSTAASGGPQCALLPLLAQQIQQLSSAAGALPLPIPGVPTNLQDAITQFNSLIPGCAAQGPNYDYAPGQPLKPIGGPSTPDFCPDDKKHRGHGRHDGYPGGGPDTSTSTAASSAAKGSNPAGLIPQLPIPGPTDATSGQGTGIPGLNAAAPAAAPQQAAAPQPYAAAPAQGYATGYGQGYGQGYGGGMGPGAQQASGGGADSFAAAPYGQYPAYDGSYGGNYGHPGGFYDYGNDGYGHDGYRHDDHDYNPCGNGSEPHGNGDDHHDYGQVNHVPDGSVNTGDGSTVTGVERTTG